MIKKLQKFLKVKQTGFFDEKTKQAWKKYCYNTPGMSFYAQLIPCCDNLSPEFQKFLDENLKKVAKKSQDSKSQKEAVAKEIKDEKVIETPEEKD